MENTGVSSAGAVLDRRRAGVLLHPTSLPSRRLDDDVLRFLDFLAEAGFTVWQMLPMGSVPHGASPYSPDSAFAGNSYLLPAEEHQQPPKTVRSEAFEIYTREQQHWLTDYGLFRALKIKYPGLPWWRWPEPERNRNSDALKSLEQELHAEIQATTINQLRFHEHWQWLRREAGQRGIQLYGDLPMFVEANSADVWANRNLFKLDRDGQPAFVAGVPPDAFAELGQCWNNPVYDWQAMIAGDFSWWCQRLRLECQRFDLLRWDHFRGLEATWEIPRASDNQPPQALQGQWRRVPGHALLTRLQQQMGHLPLVAENLGVITPEVEALRQAFNLPGMHVLQFAFDGHADNPHVPSRHEEQGVVYTGTHDNDTLAGWLSQLDKRDRDRIFEQLGLNAGAGLDGLVSVALESRCRLAMLPMQDILQLGQDARMNVPGQADGHWRWCMTSGQLTSIPVAEWRARLGDAERLRS